MGLPVVATSEGWAENDSETEATLLAVNGCDDSAVLTAMARVRRELFVAEELQSEAHLDRALPIGEGQYMASPSLVARTLQLLALTPGDRLLEIGTGSGYSAAVAAHLAREVYTVERNANLARAARCFLGRLGYGKVFVKHGDGADGWPEAGPFDAISVTVSDPSLIQPLLQQLNVGGRLVMTMGDSAASDALLLVTRTHSGFVEDSARNPRRVGPSIRSLSAVSAASAVRYPLSCA